MWHRDYVSYEYAPQKYVAEIRETITWGDFYESILSVIEDDIVLQLLAIYTRTKCLERGI